MLLLLEQAEVTLHTEATVPCQMTGLNKMTEVMLLLLEEAALAQRSCSEKTEVMLAAALPWIPQCHVRWRAVSLEDDMEGYCDICCCFILE